jgi:hypothetical protein
MSEDDKTDRRVLHVRSRIAAAFPKLAGPKLDKLLQTDEAK